jgi:hypothetical protein
MQDESLKEMRMKNLVTDSTRQLSGSGLMPAPFRPAKTAVRRATSEQTRVTPTGAPATVLGQTYRIDVMGGRDKGDFDVMGGPDRGGFDVMGRSDLEGYDVMGGRDRGDFDVLGGPDRGGFDVLGYKR